MAGAPHCEIKSQPILGRSSPESFVSRLFSGAQSRRIQQTNPRPILRDRVLSSTYAQNSRVRSFQNLFYAEKLDPQPQELVALGFLKTKPRPITSSLKSISVPLRYR